MHDMTVAVPATADAMGRVCVYCHTPHHALKDEGLNNYPLWNHDLVDVSTYVPYTWATPANTDSSMAINQATMLMGPSRLCMSCHDGSIAVDEHGGTLAQTGSVSSIATRAKLTNDLSNTHPIGFNYNNAASVRNAKAGNGSLSAGGAAEIVPSTYGFATAIKITTDSALNQMTYNDVTRNDGVNHKIIADVLYQGDYMTCATCHEVHNKENVKQDNYNGLNSTDSSKAPNFFLYAKETQSLICLSCHVK
jgi:Zn-finger protein